MPKLCTLDAMRWVAAMVVAAYHFGFFSGVTTSPNLAVDFFFALSGFVIAYAYDRKLSQGMTGEEFLQRRLVRLYPLFFVGMALGLLVTLVGSTHDGFTDNDGPYLVQFLAALVFLPWPSDAVAETAEALVSPLNGPYWSLILEIHINVLFAIFFRWLGVGVLATLAALFAIGLVGMSWSHGSVGTGYLTQDFHHGIVRVGFSFLAGLLICRVRDRIKVPRLHWSVAIAVVGALLVMPVPDGVRWVYEAACVIVAFPLLILAGAQSQPQNKRILTLFGWMGGASYALYAIHEPLANISEFLAETNPEIPYRVWSLPFFVAAMALAFALDRMFDVPFRRWLTQKFLARHAMAPVYPNARSQETGP
jgi:peptidoglycan/LPS O-acetylase OafA/YrhL